MTNRFLLAASLGYFSVLSVSAQPATNSIALRTETTAAPFLPVADENLVDFCGEHLPANHPTITPRWFRTLSRQGALAGSLALLKRRAQVVFPLIEPILKEYQIPSDFKYLPLLESAVTNRAVSRRGAAGFWQLMPQTAQSLGLQVSKKKDDRFNLLKATHAACRYIKQLYQQLGSWMLTASAYNAGPSYIQQLSRQHPHLHPMALPYRAAETKAYLYQAVAIKELITRPQAYRDYLSQHHFTLLSDEASSTLSPAEQTAILTSFELEQPAPLLDSATTVVLLADDDIAPAPDSAQNIEYQPAQTAQIADVPRLATRSLSQGTLSESQLFVFQVVQPIVLQGRRFEVGDVIHAHVEVIDSASGRVYLRTDRLTTAQKQETVPVRLVATGQPHQPGVPLPTRLEGWGLNWEAL